MTAALVVQLLGANCLFLVVLSVARLEQRLAHEPLVVFALQPSHLGGHMASDNHPSPYPRSSLRTKRVVVAELAAGMRMHKVRLPVLLWQVLAAVAVLIGPRSLAHQVCMRRSGLVEGDQLVEHSQACTLWLMRISCVCS